MAETIKNKAKRLLKEVRELLADKQLPERVRKALEDVPAALNATWEELEAEATIDGSYAVTAESDERLAEVIRKEGDKWVLYTSDGSRKLGEFDTYEEALERERQIQYFKRHKEAAEEAMMSQAAAAADYVLKESDAALREKRGNIAALIDTFDDWAGGSVEKCAEILADKEGIENPIVLCAWLKDRATGTTYWRGKQEEAALPADAAELAEAESGRAVAIDEAQGSGPLTLEVELIQPGWGNSRDNHYYSAEMLRRCASAFRGVKMFETDHRENEKSTRTWVSTITDIVRFSDTGAPVARVVVHDPGFAARVRNLAKAGLLEQLPCSINATGQARPGEVGGRKGKIVEAITAVHSVDWVTKAGAGGRAVGLVESAAEAEEEPVTEGELEAVAIKERAKPLERETVRTVLREAGLPGELVEALSIGEYESEEQVRQAVAAAKRAMKAAGSGRVRGLGETVPVPTNNPEAIREREQAILEKYGILRRV